MIATPPNREPSDKLTNVNKKGRVLYKTSLKRMRPSGMPRPLAPSTAGDCNSSMMAVLN